MNGPRRRSWPEEEDGHRHSGGVSGAAMLCASVHVRMVEEGKGLATDLSDLLGRQARLPGHAVQDGLHHQRRLHHAGRSHGRARRQVGAHDLERGVQVGDVVGLLQVHLIAPARAREGSGRAEGMRWVEE